MKDISNLPLEEQDHFIQCSCGTYVDMRNLSEVFRHLHAQKAPEPQWSHSMKKGTSTAYSRNGKKIELN